MSEKVKNINENLLEKAMGLFDTSEKWNAFLELINIKEDIQNRWWKKLQTAVVNSEQSNEDPNWEINIDDECGIYWFIKGETIGTISVYYCKERFGVWYGDDLDTKKVAELLKKPKFDRAFRNCYRIGEKSNNTLGWEYGNFSFGSTNDGNIPIEELSSYAVYDTEKFVTQIIAKVRNFQTSEITALFKEINKKCRKK